MVIKLVTLDPPDPLNPLGRTVMHKLDVAGAATALIQDIKEVGVNKFYLTDVHGTFSGRDGIFSKDGYKAIITKTDLKGRVERAFRGFDGVQTTLS